MKLEQSANKLFTNKYFLYAVVFFSVMNLLGYMMVNNINAVAFFVAVGIIMINFSQNMAVVLTVCLIATNFLMASKIREGMESGSSSSSKKSSTSTDESSTSTDTTTGTSDETKDKIKEKVQEKLNSSSASSGSTDTAPHIPSEEEVNGDAANGFKPMDEPKNPKLLHGASIQAAYSDLNSILDPTAIKSLTAETMQLMNEQKKLYESMNSMAPLLNQAKSLLDGFDMKQLNGLATMAKDFKP